MKTPALSFCGLLLLASLAPAAQFKFATQTLTVPDGFEVEIVAGTDLVPRPVSGSFDELGRLYVTDSSGSNAKPAEQTNNPTHRVMRLEDTDGDGKFDKSVVFADKVMFPEGCLWYDGSVYVAAPPHIWKFTDTNNDGVADKREIWHDGQTLTGCANDLHGPFLGPDGWIYWCKGAFASQTYEVNGKPWTSRASHIFRARPDHSRFEPVITAGNDNPVGLTWTTTGERILCGTFFAPHELGHRDGMIHAVYGGVWGKPNDALDGHKRTGDLMPVMTHMGAAAPCAVICYKSLNFGGDYQGNVFCCQFNLHKVSRHILSPHWGYDRFDSDATFRTQNSDFLVSDNPDFHPTDVIEDADGSLLVLDTGAWYKLCCPTSQLAKPDVLGAIYRIRRKGSHPSGDLRGNKIAWNRATPTELTEFLSVQRPVLAERAIEELAKRGEASVPALAEVLKTSKNMDARLNAVWALTRIDHASARQAVHAALPKDRTDESPYDWESQYAALYSIGLWRDASAIRLPAGVDSWTEVAFGHLWGIANVFAQRLAIEALGRIEADSNFKVQRLLSVPHRSPFGRTLEHSLIHSLIEINDPAATRAGLTNFFSQRIALIALDQMESGNLKAEEVLPFLKTIDKEQREAAVWVAGHHPEWGGALAGFFRERLVADLKDADRGELESQLAQFSSSAPVQQLFVESLNASGLPTATRQLLLRLMAQPGLKDAPAGWADAIRAVLEQKDDTLVRTAIPAARALAQAKNNPPSFTEPLQRIARDTARPDDLRLDALAALPRGLSSVEPALMTFLCANIDPTKSVAMRGAAAGVLAKAKLTEAQLITLAGTLTVAGPMEVAKLLPAFEHSTNEATGLRLMAALKESKGLVGVQPDTLKAVAKKYPATVQEQADALLASLNADAEKQKAQLETLLASLPPGDIRRGQLVFNNPKAACASCHRMGYLGGNVGPDLTAIGPTRTERDLLEAIVFPSASFVRSYEPYTIVTKNDEDYSGVLRKDAPDEVVLATGPNAEVRVARTDITEMRPGRVSLMPAGLDQQLSKQELSDLVTFLKNTKWGAN